MNRRAFLSALGLLTGSRRVHAQQLVRTPRIGVLGAVSPDGAPHTAALVEGLRDLGYVEGRTILIEWRWARGDATRFPDLASDLVRQNLDIIVADNNPAIAAVQKVTRTIPIVMVVATDPVRLGFVASLARPGSNVTGLSFMGIEPGKRLQLLKDIVPNVSRIAVLWDPTEPGRREAISETEAAAKTLGVQLQLIEVRNVADLERSFATARGKGAGAVFVHGSSMMYTHRARIGDLGAANRLPTMCGARGYAETGCLISYNASFSDLFRRSATYVDKILKGAKPGDLPIEQPTKFELVINLKTAKGLGLKIPPSLLQRAEQLIE